MADHVADFVLKRLREWGVHRIYGYPGDGINAFLGALDRARTGDPEFIQARHEEMAAFMACGHAKFAGPDTVGVCMATSGPGAIHLLNGLYDAKLDHVPVLAIVGQQKRSVARLALPAGDRPAVALQGRLRVRRDVHRAGAGAPSDRPRDPHRARPQRRVRAHRSRTTSQEMKAVPSPPRAHGSVYSSVGYTRPRVLPQERDIQHAAEILNEGEKVAILIGQGARGAAAEVEQIADLLGAGVAKALLGKDVLADDLPYVTGSDRPARDDPEQRHDRGCDTLLMVGTSFPYAEFLPKEGQARCVEIDIDARVHRHPLSRRRACSSATRRRRCARSSRT